MKTEENLVAETEIPKPLDNSDINELLEELMVPSDRPWLDDDDTDDFLDELDAGIWNYEILWFWQKKKKQQALCDLFNICAGIDEEAGTCGMSLANKCLLREDFKIACSLLEEYKGPLVYCDYGIDVTMTQFISACRQRWLNLNDSEK